MFDKKYDLPGTGPHTLGIISKIAEQDGSSKHNCLAKIQFKMAIADLLFEPVNSEKYEIKIGLLTKELFISNFNWN